MRLSKQVKTFLFCILIAFTAVPLATAATDDPASPQDDDEPLLEQLRDLFKNEFLEFGTLLQMGAQYSDARTGFSLGTARLNMQGTLDGGFGYKLQTDFARSIAILDALIGYQATPNIGFTGGRYKAPFSFEELTSSSETPFVNRSRIVRALAPGRQIGTNVTGAVTSTVNVHLGLYNGNGANLGDNNNRFLYVGRVESVSENNARSLVIGANAGYNDAPNEFGETLVGADFHVEQGNLLVGAEAIYGRQETPATAVNPFGHYLTVGYTLPAAETFHQLLIRWDRFTPDTNLDASDHFLLGYVVTPTGAIRFEANYVIPLENVLQNHQALIQLQLAF